MAWTSKKPKVEHLALHEPKNKITPAPQVMTAKHGLVVTRAADLTPQKLARVWNGRFALGKIGFIAGEPGLGKSLIAAYMTATVSTGVLQSLRKPRLLIIDPINACLSPTDFHRFNPNSVTQVRALLGRLEALAVKRRVAVVCVSHLTKAKSGSTLARVTGSFAFVAAARSVFTVERRLDDPTRRVLAPAKNNLGGDGNPLAFRIEERLTTGKIPTPYALFASG
jgi:predicted ATP-dependent serine protease